jgi:hypothetical protein
MRRNTLSSEFRINPKFGGAEAIVEKATCVVRFILKHLYFD